MCRKLCTGDRIDNILNFCKNIGLSNAIKEPKTAPKKLQPKPLVVLTSNKMTTPTKTPESKQKNNGP